MGKNSKTQISDFKKNRISKKAFDLLIELCKETDLKENINKYFNGSSINETENRSVLHTALRSKNNDSTEISEEVKNTLSKIYQHFLINLMI